MAEVLSSANSAEAISSRELRGSSSSIVEDLRTVADEACFQPNRAQLARCHSVSTPQFLDVVNIPSAYFSLDDNLHPLNRILRMTVVIRSFGAMPLAPSPRDNLQSCSLALSNQLSDIQASRSAAECADADVVGEQQFLLLPSDVLWYGFARCQSPGYEKYGTGSTVIVFIRSLKQSSDRYENIDFGAFLKDFGVSQSQPWTCQSTETASSAPVVNLTGLTSETSTLCERLMEGYALLPRESTFITALKIKAFMIVNAGL